MTKCKKNTRKCVDGKCYYKRKQHWRKSKKPRCKLGTRRCNDNKCHKKIDLN
jgi:hypothetical protein